MKWWLSSQSKSEKAALTAVIWFQPHTPTAGLNAKFWFFLITTFCSAVHIMFAATPQTLTAYPKPGCICPCTFCKRRFKISESIFIVYQLNRLWLYTLCREIQYIIFRKSGGTWDIVRNLFFTDRIIFHSGGLCSTTFWFSESSPGNVFFGGENLRLSILLNCNGNGTWDAQTNSCRHKPLCFSYCETIQSVSDWCNYIQKIDLAVCRGQRDSLVEMVHKEVICTAQ